MISKWRPWEKSSGPKTQEGKHRAAIRGFKGAVRPTAKALRAQEMALKELE